MLQLYKNIKEKREELGISQDELAKLTGYTSRSSIAKIEKGTVDLPQTKIMLFAKALNTTPAYLMGWEEQKETSSPPTPIDPDVKEFSSIYAKLDSTDRTVIKATANTLLNADKCKKNTESYRIIRTEPLA